MRACNQGRRRTARVEPRCRAAADSIIIFHGVSPPQLRRDVPSSAVVASIFSSICCAALSRPRAMHAEPSRADSRQPGQHSRRRGFPHSPLHPPTIITTSIPTPCFPHHNLCHHQAPTTYSAYSSLLYSLCTRAHVCRARLHASARSYARGPCARMKILPACGR